MKKHLDPRTNELLAALPEADLRRWLQSLEWVDLPLGPVVQESGCQMGHASFPTLVIVSLHYVMENEASAEIAVSGREGLVGVSLLMGGGSIPSRAVVQCAGEGFRIGRAFSANKSSRPPQREARRGATGASAGSCFLRSDLPLSANFWAD